MIDERHTRLQLAHLFSRKGWRLHAFVDELCNISPDLYLSFGILVVG